MAAKIKQRQHTGQQPRDAERPDSKTTERTKKRGRAVGTERLKTISDIASEPDDRYPQYDDEQEYDIIDGIADGWLEDEADGIHPIDDISESPASTESKQPCIIRFIDSDGLQYDLSPRHHNLQESMDAKLAGEEVLIREERHARLANVLIEYQSAALKADTPRKAYEDLKYMMQGEHNDTIAQEQEYNPKKPSSSWLSRTSHEMIACQWGTVPQQFFFWAPKPHYWTKDEDGKDIKVDHVYDKRKVFGELLNVALARFHYLAGNDQNGWARARLDGLKDKSLEDYVDHFFGPIQRTSTTKISNEPFPLLDGEASALARLALAVDDGYRSADDQSQKVSRDSIRKLVKLANAIVSDLRFRIEKLRRSCELWHEDELKSDPVLKRPSSSGRGMELLKFAIAGWEPKPDEAWYLPQRILKFAIAGWELEPGESWYLPQRSCPVTQLVR